MKAPTFSIILLLWATVFLLPAVNKSWPRERDLQLSRTVSGQAVVLGNHALQFAGTPNFVVIAPSPSINIGLNMTIEFWVQTTANYGGSAWHDAQWILDKDIKGEVKRDWALVIRFGRVVFNNGNPSGSRDQPLYSSTSINDGSWHHIAVTRDTSSGRTTIYIDGHKDVEGVFSADDLSNTLPLRIGTEDVAPTARAFVGKIDELRLWNTVRSEQEIRSYMTKHLSGSEPGLVGYWRMDEGSGQTIFDATPFHNDGQLGSSSNPDDNDPQWASGVEPSLSITHIEVTQATQDVTNSVPLIAGKPTFVRVYVSCPPDGEVPQNVAADLQGFGPPGELGAPLAPFSGYLRTACRESFEAQRADLRKTLNFALPTEWTQGTLRLLAKVEGAAGEERVTFQAGHDLRIAWVAMPYVPPQPPPPPGPTPTPVVVRPDQKAAAKGPTDLLLIYPVAPKNVAYFFQPGFDQPMREPFTCRPPYSYCPADTRYLTALNDFWNRMDREGYWMGGSPPDRLYGWVPQAAQGNLCGIADAIWANPKKRKGRVAAGLDSCGAETLAHELGHLLDDKGLRHAPGCGASGHDPSYPNPDGSIGEWGVRITESGAALLDPHRTYDFMSYCSPEWVSPYHYRRLNEGFTPTGMRISAQALATPQRQFLASGIVFSPALTVTLGPLFVISSAVPPDPEVDGAYCLELRDATETPLGRRCFDLTFTNPETGDPTGAEGFSLALPYPDGTQAVVVTHNGTELTRATASPNTPQVQLLSPNGGEIWQAGETYTVTWTANDADGETLHYAISFSADGGISWIPLVLDTSQTEWVIDASRLPGTDNAVIRIEASDGFNVRMDVSDACFTVGRKAPQAFILAPKAGSLILPDTPLFLQGYAYDLEDGTLEDAALSWASSLDGPLGTGAMVLADLSPGAHLLTLTATDNDSNQATATVRLFVGYNTYLPLVVQNR